MRTLAGWSSVTVAVLLLLGGCTYIHKEEAHQVESTLAAAGFQARPADSPAKMEKLKLLPQRKLRSKTKDGELIYFYADAEFCQCLYVGDQAAYSRYQQLAIQQKIAQEQMNAAEMNEDAAMDWGMWGPFW